MFDAPVGFAFGAGMVAAFNPCGFALLPAYLGLFLAGGQEHADTSDGRVVGTVRRAVLVPGAVTLGFVAVFGTAALLISRTAVTVQEYTPWITLVVGLALIPAGIAMLRGWSPKIRLPSAGRRVSGTGPAAMFWFGVSYATVSLSCTIPAFLVAVVGTFSDRSAASGLLVFAAYTAGMASVLVLATVVVATAQHGALGAMRRVLPHVNTAAGALAVLAGAYVAYYGWYELQLNAGRTPPAGPVSAVGALSGTVTTWVDGLPRVVVVLAPSALVALLLWNGSRRRSPRASP